MRMVSAASLEVATKHKVPRLALGRFAPARGARDDKGVEKTNDKVLRGWSAVLHSADVGPRTSRGEDCVVRRSEYTA